jgi:hypothetical protein
MTEHRAPYRTVEIEQPQPLAIDDRAFAESIRRLLISIAELIRRRYGSEVLLIILKGR